MLPCSQEPQPHPSGAERGLVPHRLAGLYQHLYLDICPPSMQITAINDLEAVQPLGRADITSAPGDLAWIDELADRPIVYVTLGTIYNRDASIFQTILAGLVDHDVSVVVTVGRDNDPAMLGPQPANVVVRRFVPQAALLPRCSMVVTHGGAGSVLGALSFGLPLLVVPQSADQFYNAERVDRGWGRGLVDAARSDRGCGPVCGPSARRGPDISPGGPAHQDRVRRHARPRIHPPAPPATRLPRLTTSRSHVNGCTTGLIRSCAAAGWTVPWP